MEYNFHMNILIQIESQLYLFIVLIYISDIHSSTFSYSIETLKLQYGFTKILGLHQMVWLSLFPLYCFYNSMVHGITTRVSSMIDNES